LNSDYDGHRSPVIDAAIASASRGSIPGAERALQVDSTEEYPMNFIIWLVVGGLIGWIASKIMRTDAQQGVFLNIVVGIVGSMLGGWLISPLVGAGTINQSDFSLAGLFVSLVGAVILLAIVNLFRRGKAR
jgi:uncharacterized membrane protein YeaQ/YmgE (transglycosylase-associated protein family)